MKKIGPRQKNARLHQPLAAAALALLLGAAPLAVVAQQQPAGAASDTAGQATVRNQNGISYVTGGIAESGQQRVRELGKDMNLQLVFAKAGTGDYLANVDVTISHKGGGGQVLSVKGADPILFAQLKPGSYVVTATPPQGKTIERTVEVPAKGQRMETLTW